MADGLQLGSPLSAPPRNEMAEQALLGGLLASNKAYDDVAAFLRAEHFFDPAHGAIFGAIARRIDAGGLADAVTLARASAEWAGSFDTVQAARGYLAQLVAAMVSPSAVRSYAEVIVDCWHRRALIEIGIELVARSRAPGDLTARAIHEAAEEALSRLADGQDSENVLMPAHEAMALAIDAATLARDAPGGLIGISTGLRALDDITGGLQVADLTTLGARPSMGKTSLALSIAVGAADAGERVLFVSAEMIARDLGAQLVAGTAPVSRDAATRGKVQGRDLSGRFEWHQATDAEFELMTAAQRAMVQRKLMVLDLRTRTMAAIRSYATRAKRRGGLGLIVVDHLGELRVPDLARSGDRTLEVERLARDMKALARDLGVAVLMLCQLNRGTESRENRRPTLHDLKQSGAIEEVSDVVAFLYRDHYYLSRNPPARGERDTDEQWANRLSRHAQEVAAAEGVAEVDIAKNRKGRTGRVRLRFGHETTWFTDLPEGSE